MNPYKLIYGLEGSILQSALGDFQEMDTKADEVMLAACQDLQPGGEFAGKTFIIVLLRPDGGVCYARSYAVGH